MENVEQFNQIVAPLREKRTGSEVEFRYPDKCPACATGDSLIACGPGVERLAEEAAELIMDAEHAGLGQADAPEAARRLAQERNLGAEEPVGVENHVRAPAD